MHKQRLCTCELAMLLNRYTAFSIHFALSLLIFLSLVAVMYFYWFPGDLFFMDGGWEGIKLVAMVDLVLGPFLTLLLFKRGKPSLVFDMSVIAAIQVAALAYGFYATYNQRIVAYVYSDEQFNTLTISEYRESSNTLTEKGETPQPLTRFGDKFPVNVYTQPFDRDSYGEYLVSIFNDFPEIRERSDMYLDIREHHPQLAARQLTQESLQNEGRLEALTQAVKSAGHELDAVELYPLQARFEAGIAVFDPHSKRIVDVIRDTKISKFAAQKENTGRNETDDTPVTVTDNQLEQ